MKEQQLAAEPSSLEKVCEALGIGIHQRKLSTALINIENLIRRSRCLSALEEALFTREIADDPEDGVTHECLVSWGAEPAEYVQQAKAALASIAPNHSEIPNSSQGGNHPEFPDSSQSVDRRSGLPVNWQKKAEWLEHENAVLKTALVSQGAGEVVAWYRDTEVDANEDSQGLPPRYFKYRDVRKHSQRPDGDDWLPLYTRPKSPAQGVPEDVAKDAARYRWLRSPTQDVGNVVDKQVAQGVWEYRAGDELDAAIDAAIAIAPKREAIQ